MRTVSHGTGTHYATALSEFTGRVRITDVLRNVTEAEAEAVMVLIENDTVVVDDGVNPRRLILQPVVIEEIRDSQPPAPV